MEHTEATRRAVAEAALVPGVRLIEGLALKDMTTLHVGGLPTAVLVADSGESTAAVVKLLDEAHVPVLIVGGGSNLLVSDEPLAVVVVVNSCTTITIDESTGLVSAAAGATWDAVVDATVKAGLGGIECLSGVPGCAGAVPVQNVGAYGVEIADVLVEVRLYNRETKEVETVAPWQLDLQYRYSNLKHTSRAVVLGITLQLSPGGYSAPLRFGQLAKLLGIDPSETHARRPVAQVREAVLSLRRAKGMVYDDTDRDTWSAGSFFTNPIVDPRAVDGIRERVRERCGEKENEAMPCFETSGGIKLSAAWLIDRAGFDRGYPGEGAPARLSTKHTLALTNRGSATAADLVALATTVRDGVYDAFGVELHPEPVWVGVEMPPLVSSACRVPGGL